MAQEISNTQDIIDSRDIIERIEEIESEAQGRLIDSQEDEGTSWGELADIDYQAHLDEEDYEELVRLRALVEEIRDNSEEDPDDGVTLIHDSYFVDAMQELVQDIGDLPSDIPGYLVIDWDETADNLREDYRDINFDGETYWVR